MDNQEIINVLNLAQAELRATYKRLNIKGSNVLTSMDNALDELIKEEVETNKNTANLNTLTH